MKRFKVYLGSREISTIRINGIWITPSDDHKTDKALYDHLFEVGQKAADLAMEKAYRIWIKHYGVPREKL